MRENLYLRASVKFSDVFFFNDVTRNMLQEIIEFCSKYWPAKKVYSLTVNINENIELTG